jgi:mono/diheme cytochrome c family protein
MNIRRIATWTIGVLAVLALVAFLAFLYLIPPFTLIAPEEIIGPESAAAAALDSIADPKTRAMAERGKYIVKITGCADCHSSPGATGPDFATRYMAGGAKTSFKGHGTFVSANLTSDPATGLARRTDEDVLRVLRSGVSPEGGRMLWYRDMPWPWVSNWTEEDRRAVLVYLRQIAPIAHRIPPPSDSSSVTYDPAAIEEASAKDAGGNP